MDRLGFIILSILQGHGATGRLSSMTAREIVLAEDLGLKENTVYKKINNFEKSGQVRRGLKEGRADTYYITPEGYRCLEEERGRP